MQFKICSISMGQAVNCLKSIINYFTKLISLNCQNKMVLKQVKYNFGQIKYLVIGSFIQKNLPQTRYYILFVFDMCFSDWQTCAGSVFYINLDSIPGTNNKQVENTCREMNFFLTIQMFGIIYKNKRKQNKTQPINPWNVVVRAGAVITTKGPLKQMSKSALRANLAWGYTPLEKQECITCDAKRS